jgi:hypothetical protein
MGIEVMFEPTNTTDTLKSHIALAINSAFLAMLMRDYFERNEVKPESQEGILNAFRKAMVIKFQADLKEELNSPMGQLYAQWLGDDSAEYELQYLKQLDEVIDAWKEALSINLTQ